MPEIDVSLKRYVIIRFVSLLVIILLSGRVMLSDPNIVYRYIGTLTFVGFNMRAIMLVLYIQYRSRDGWKNTVDLPDD